MLFKARVNNRIYDDFSSLCDRLGLIWDTEVEIMLIDRISRLSLVWAATDEGLHALSPMVAVETRSLFGDIE